LEGHWKRGRSTPKKPEATELMSPSATEQTQGQTNSCCRYTTVGTGVYNYQQRQRGAFLVHVQAQLEMNTWTNGKHHSNTMESRRQPAPEKLESKCFQRVVSVKYFMTRLDEWVCVCVGGRLLSMRRAQTRTGSYHLTLKGNGIMSSAQSNVALERITFRSKV
jgi:hypothetical protein